MAFSEAYEEIMECFTCGYQQLKDLESKENLSYDRINEDLTTFSSDWEALEEETASQIEKIVEWFTPYTEHEPKESEVDIAVSRAKLLEDTFRDLLTRHANLGARETVNLRFVEDQCKFSETRKNNIVKHLGRALILSVLLGMILGGVITWASAKTLQWEIFGVLIGGSAFLIIGGLIYFVFVAVAVRGVRKWKGLKERMSRSQDMARFIKRKAQELDIMPVLLQMIVDGPQSIMIRDCSKKLVEQCKKYNSVTK